MTFTPGQILNGIKNGVNYTDFVIEEVRDADYMDANGYHSIAREMRESETVELFIRRPKGQVLYTTIAYPNGTFSKPWSFGRGR